MTGVVAACAAAPAAAAPPVRAVQISTFWNALATEDLDRELTEAARVGANTVRVPLFWSGLQPYNRTIEPYYAARLDYLASAAQSRDLRLLPTFMSTPCWASRSASNCGAYAPRNYADWSSIVQWLLKRYSSRFVGLEVWNEPNLSGFWQGSVSEYVKLVSTAKDARRSAGVSVPIIAGALAGADHTYLKKLFSAGVNAHADAISAHPYDLSWATPTGQFGDPTVPRPGDPTGSFAYGVPNLRDVMTSSGASSKKLWLTEFGYATCPAYPTCVSEQQAADWMTGALNLVDSWSYVEAFGIYSVRDFAGSGDQNFHQHFGLLTNDWQQKPAWTSVAQAWGAVA